MPRKTQDAPHHPNQCRATIALLKRVTRHNVKDVLEEAGTVQCRYGRRHKADGETAFDYHVADGPSGTLVVWVDGEHTAELPRRR